MKLVQVKVGDEVRCQRSTRRGRGKVVEVASRYILVEAKGGGATKWRHEDVVEIVSHAAPPAPAAAVVTVCEGCGVPVPASVQLCASCHKDESVVASPAVRGGVRANSMLGMAIGVLKERGPMHVKALTAEVISRGFISTGKTPQATLAAHLLTAEKKGLVAKVAPATFEVVA